MSNWTSTTDVRPRLDDIEAHLPADWHLVLVGADELPVAVGPGGVFALIVRRPGDEPITVYDRGLFIRNRRSHALTSARTRAAVVSGELFRLLRTQIECSCVVVLPAGNLTVRSRPRDVHILHDHLLARWLSHLPRSLDDGQVLHIVRMVRLTSREH